MVDMSTDLSDICLPVFGNATGRPTPTILRLQATRDTFVQQMISRQDEFDQHFPNHGTENITKWIEGGTHHGFASYESTWAGSSSSSSSSSSESSSSSASAAADSDGDGTNISYTDQQQKACDETIRFLLDIMDDEKEDD